MADSQEQQLYNLMLLAEEQQKAAGAAVAALAKERAALTSTVQTLQNAVSKAAADQVRESIGEAPKEAVEALNQAVEALRNAAADVRGAGAWVSYKTAAAVGLVGVLMLATVYGIGRYMVASTQSEIRDLRAERDTLQAAVEDLQRRGGKAKLTTCGNRLCIEASSNQGEGYEQWGAPWKAQNGSNLVILRGY